MGKCEIGVLQRCPERGEDHLLLGRLVSGELFHDLQVQRARLDRIDGRIESLDECFDRSVIEQQELDGVALVRHGVVLPINRIIPDRSPSATVPKVRVRSTDCRALVPGTAATTVHTIDAMSSQPSGRSLHNSSRSMRTERWPGSVGDHGWMTVAT